MKLINLPLLSKSSGRTKTNAILNIAETTLKNIDDFFAGRKLENEVCFNCKN